MAALAQATRRLRLGTLVTDIHYRHPAVRANMAATLDVISDGRLELGVGAGWSRWRTSRPSCPDRDTARSAGVYAGHSV
ncbi:LLM class flavin-dependent oxidoreductase [Streptomyces sp. NPDC101165]|uniref:LLM class flavin-dependent oxidoreductase n=1 Tax=Streptomyces sp. NPDC101165 TaxID=3366119 RepID=UPI00382DFDFE